ncbi:hypothetical protein B0H14DRAFT_2640223 [Mycena olivaceomarginata]|nr:hypothetical protein B0H14DRAFT_2640223 [Mycena olivaceomarginata]
MNNTRLEMQEVENAVVSIRFFFPIPGCFLTSPFRSVQFLSIPALLGFFLAGFNVEHRRPSRLAMHHHTKQVILTAAGSGISSSGDSLRMQSMISSEVTFTKFATLEWVLLESYPDWIGRANPFRAPGNEVLRGGQSLLNILFKPLTQYEALRIGVILDGQLHSSPPMLAHRVWMFWTYRQGYNGPPSRPVPVQVAGHAYTHTAIFIELLKAPHIRIKSTPCARARG